MDVRRFPRSFVNGYVRALRLPAERGARLVSRGQDSPAPAEIMVERADAAVRGFFGSVLRDPELREDAARRRIAADEREHALRLRVEAERESQRADDRFAQKAQEAERRRVEAARQAEQAEAAVERTAEAERRRVAEAERKEKAATRQTVAATEEHIESQARTARLEQLEREEAALAEKEKALTAADETQRLASAATKAKAARKSG